MLESKNIEPGEEQYEYYKDYRKRCRCQYDYRDEDGTLFSCVRHKLEDCRLARNIWLDKR